jgi:F-type H+-transporting ATPase subunit delta
MGSATRGALAGTRAALAQLGRAELQVAEDLLAVGRVVGSSSQLRSALIDAEADDAQKRALVESVFGAKITADAVTLVTAAATRRWSSGDDFIAGLEDFGYRVAAESAG